MAVPTLEALLGGPHDVVAVISQPDRPRGRGRKFLPSPISEVALAAGAPLLRPDRVGEPEVAEALAKTQPDVGVVVAFGQFMPRRIRELPRLGYCINAHASLLPRYRGASPIAQAILDGQTKTGISVMRVEREMDAGPVGLVREIVIGEQENAAELTERLAALAAEALQEALDLVESGDVVWREQDASRATLAPKLSKEDGRLDWQLPARVLVQRIHGLAPRPGAFTSLPARGGLDGRREREERETLRILRARALDAGGVTLPAPGTVRRGREPGMPALCIAAGDGWIEPLTLQRAGGRAMDVAAYLRGHDIEEGALLGAAGAGGADDG
jgi:methionyl-tRNA formyltransferase